MTVPAAGCAVPYALAPRVASTAVFVAVLAANGLAGSGAMSGESIGVVANRFPSLFLPAGYVFGIWSLIYLWLTVTLVYLWGRGEGPSRALERLGPWWATAGALNIAWVTAFAFSRYAVALAVMIALIVTLVITGAQLRRDHAPSRAYRATVVWAHDLYLAWISVALIANLFQFAHVVGFGGLGLSELQWSLTMMGVATALSWWLAAGQGNWLAPLVVAWAVKGIAVRHADLAAIATAGAIIPWLSIGGGLIATVIWARRTR